MWSLLKQQNKNYSHLLHMRDALQNIMYRANNQPNMTAIFKSKLQSDLCDYLAGVSRENKYNNGYKKLKTLNEYESFRKDSSGVKSTIRWMELHNPSHYCNTSTAFDRKFEERAAVIVGIDNDLFSKPNTYDDTTTTRSVLDVMNRQQTVELRNNYMKQMVDSAVSATDSTGKRTFYIQILSFIEGIARWQLSAKKRYLTDCMNMTNDYSDAVQNSGFYHPNLMNTKWDEYTTKNKSIFNQLTEKSYHFADSHQLFVNQGVSKIYKYLNLGYFSCSYPFIDPSDSQNIKLLQIVCDFVGWLTILDDTILEFTDDPYPFLFFDECFQELHML